MMHTQARWLNKTRLHLMKLEDRTQPGSLLSTGIEASALADVLVEQKPHFRRVIKKLNSSEDAQIRSPALAQTLLLTAPATTTHTVTASTPFQRATQTVVNPALHHPTTTREQISVGGRELVRSSLVKETAPTPIIKRMDLGGHPDHLITRSVKFDAQGGTRASIFATYDAMGTNRVDAVNDVAIISSPEMCNGENYVAVGNQGRTGSIRYYDFGGNLLHSQTVIPGPGNRSAIFAVAVHPVTDEVYVVGKETTAAGALVKNYVSKFPCTGGSATATFAYPSTGAAEMLNSITVTPGVASGFDITVVGTADIGVGHDVSQVSHLNAALTTNVDITVDFGVPTQGLSHATDDGTGGGLGLGTRYVGGSIDNGVAILPLNFDLGDDDVTNIYSRTWSLGAPGPKPTSGFYGMEQHGTHLYMAGSVTDTVRNPAIAPDLDDYDNLVVADVLPSDGITAMYFLGYGITGGDWNARDNAVDPITGEQFTAGSIDDTAVQTDPQSLTVGRADQFDTAGNLIASRDSGDCDGVMNKDTDNFGIAVEHFFDGKPAVLVGGATNAGKTSFEAGLCPAGNPPQLLNGADSEYGSNPPPGGEGPPSDGYLYLDMAPIGG